MDKKTFFTTAMMALAMFAHPCLGQDTLRRANLPEVSIIQLNSRPVEVLSQTPLQVIDDKEMQKLGDAQLSDALKRLVGVTLKDYGGIGGIKTVSARGLGSQFSTLTIDGVAVTDCQNGQVDLGRYMLGNSGHISFVNGQQDNTLNSARAFAASSILNMETHEPEFGSRSFNLRCGLDAGSFGYISPTISFEQRLSDKLSVSLWSNYTQSKGNYPFTLFYTTTQKDSSSVERRLNSQMWMGTADANIFYRISSRKRLHIKTHYMQGYHALPGPVIYYLQKVGSEHSEENLFFTQARYRQEGKHWDIQLLGKYQRSHDIYEDTAVRNETHLIHNDYHQQEGYLSQVVRFHTSKGNKEQSQFSVSISTDESISLLQSNLSKHNEVQRLTGLGVIAMEYHPAKLNGLRATANILGTWICDYELDKESDPYAKLSPFAGLSYHKGAFTFRYFFKENYRVPNFNELYYFTIGKNLRPEKALQHNVGCTYRSKMRELDENHLLQTSATADIYANQVSDKIIAIPTQNMYLWSMTNLGEVQILGLDLTSDFALNGKAEHNGTVRYDILLSLGYTYQYAVDRTEPTSKVYGHQIPYTPRHSGSIALTATTPWVDLGYTVMLVGKRYCMQQNTEANRVPGYVDQGITFTREVTLSNSSLLLKLQILNIFDVQYEVVRSYPMMGRNYRIGLTWTI